MSANGGPVLRLAGWVVAVSAAVLTAHGLTEVALGSKVPFLIAWVYPVITDGLGVLAYAATSRLRPGGRLYAWLVVVVAAGLSAFAQASYLADGVAQASRELRFAVGAWPAVAAAVAAHLLYLIGTTTGADGPAAVDPGTNGSVDQVAGVQSGGVGGVQAVQAGAVQRALGSGVQSVQPGQAAAVQPERPRPVSDAAADAARSGSGAVVGRSGGPRRVLSPIDRARTTAELHVRRSGSLPSVRELQAMAQVSRGTAATAIKSLRQQTTSRPHGLRTVPTNTRQGSES